jgi:predicted ferric reductase
MILSLPVLRKLSYEIFIRVHQGLAGLFAYSIWKHVVSGQLFPLIYVYTFTGIFLGLLFIQSGILIYRNRAIGTSFSKAHIRNTGDIVQIRLELSRPLYVEAGRYICLWMPTISLWSFSHIHPFTVTSWSDEKQTSLDLFIEPRGGFTRKLLEYSKTHGDDAPCLAFFTGPHGRSAPVVKFETVLMIASGFGIAAQLPYLKQLLHGYNACRARTRRVHLVWQLETTGTLSPLRLLPTTYNT